MIVEIKKYKEFSKVTYYTVHLEGRESTEFDDFLKRMSNSLHKNQLEEIVHFINQIGNEYGAKEEYFRHERLAEALPPKFHQFISSKPNEFGLRLYCLRLSEQIVVLLNGDMKTHQNPEKCNNCCNHFKRANAISHQINQAISPDKTLELSGHEILTDDFFQIEI